ncbi:FAD-binding protein [Berryella intestinalis]|uniref:FAD-binding protein n=1 Tax=Berryella intestinalis TaxID=1531429 RepID=UPI0039BF3AF7
MNREQAKKAGAEFRFSTEAQYMIMEGGKVAGLAATSDKKSIKFNCKAVVIATGGFGARPWLRAGASSLMASRTQSMRTTSRSPACTSPGTIAAAASATSTSPPSPACRLAWRSAWGANAASRSRASLGRPRFPLRLSAADGGGRSCGCFAPFPTALRKPGACVSTPFRPCGENVRFGDTFPSSKRTGVELSGLIGAFPKGRRETAAPVGALSMKGRYHGRYPRSPVHLEKR